MQIVVIELEFYENRCVVLKECIDALKKWKWCMD